MKGAAAIGPFDDVNIRVHSCHTGTQVLTLFGLTHDRVDMMPKLEAAVRLMATVRKASSCPESFEGNRARA